MERLWQNRARPLWVGTSERPQKGELCEDRKKKQWMRVMSNSWKELVGEQPDNHSKRRRWRETVINCCQELQKVSENKNTIMDHDKQEIDVDQNDQSGNDEPATVQNLKQEEMKNKRKMWRITMRKCWTNGDKKDTEECSGSPKNEKNKSQIPGTYRKQWRQMMRQMMHGDCPVSREEMRERRKMMRRWWRNLKEGIDNTSSSSNNSSSREDGDSDEDVHVNHTKCKDTHLKDTMNQQTVSPSSHSILQVQYYYIGLH